MCVHGVFCEYIYSCSDLLHFDLHAYGSLPACLKQNDDASCTELYLRFFSFFFVRFFFSVRRWFCLASSCISYFLRCAFPFKRCHCIRDALRNIHFILLSALCVHSLCCLKNGSLFFFFIFFTHSYLCDKYHFEGKKERRIPVLFLVYEPSTAFPKLNLKLQRFSNMYWFENALERCGLKFQNYF